MTATRRVVIALALLVMSASICLGKSNGNKQTEVTLIAVTLMPDGARLQPGVYRMELLNDANAPQVAFYMHNKLLCKCPVKIENAPMKPPYTKAQFEVAGNGTRVLKSIEVAGWPEVIIFSGTGAALSGS